MDLKKGQIIYIDDVSWYVQNMIEFGEDGWVGSWKEYEIRNKATGDRRWLSIEKDDNGEDTYYLYEATSERVSKDIKEYLAQNGKRYELMEDSIAVVRNYFGNADVDIGERCIYYDFICKDDNSIISLEGWNDDGSIEEEYTIGYPYDQSRIRISEEFTRVQKDFSGSGFSKAMIWIYVIIALLSIIVPIFEGSSLFVNKSMEKYLKDVKHEYTYVTSVTNNVNNKVAKVYKSPFSTVELTVKDIIDGVPEGITDTLESSDKESVGLQTKSEYAYVYKEGSEVFVQISDLEYVSNSGSTYHSRHTSYYRNTYVRRSINKLYNNYLSSARQSSVSSRTSFGGGTSSGK